MVNRKKIKEKEKKSKTERRKKEFYYSFLTIVLLLCLIQIGFSAIKNITKLISLKAKIVTMKKTLNEAEEHNEKLKEENKLYSSTQNLEGIARNTLKMAGKDEVLIIINKDDEVNKEKNTEVNNAQ